MYRSGLELDGNAPEWCSSSFAETIRSMMPSDVTL